MATGIIFLGLGVYLGDPRPFSFGVVFLLIASAKHLLIPNKQNLNRPN